MRAKQLFIVAVLLLPHSVMALVKWVHTYIAALMSHPRFQNADPSAAQLGAAADQLQALDTQVEGRAPGAREARDKAKATLIQLLHQSLAWVQKTVNANQATAEADIRSLGLGVRKSHGPLPKGFTVVNGKHSGEVNLTAPKAGQRASYAWQWSTDLKTWMGPVITLQAKVVIRGLTPVTICYFRYKAVTKSGEGDWSEPISIVVK